MLMFYFIVVLMWKGLYNFHVSFWNLGGWEWRYRTRLKKWCWRPVPAFQAGNEHRVDCVNVSVHTCVFLHVCLWGSKVQEVHGRPPTARNAEQMFSTFHVRINPVMWTTKKQPFLIQHSLFQHKTTHCSVLTALIVISARRPFQSDSVLSVFLSHPLSSLRACTPLFHFLKYKPVPDIELLLKFTQW